MNRNPLTFIKTLFTVFLATVFTVFALAVAFATTPTNVNVIMTQAGSTALTVSWSYPGSAPQGYWIMRNGGLLQLSTSATTVTWRDTSLSPGVTYVYKVAASTASGLSPWSLKARGTTLTSASDTASFAKPHDAFTNNSNMCQACHSVHMAPTRFKALYYRYSEVSAAYSSVGGTQQPGVDLCFNCHDGTGARNNIKELFEDTVSYGSDNRAGHRTRTTAGLSGITQGMGWRGDVTVPVGYQLPCMTCHDAHVSSLGNYKMLADELYIYAKTTNANNKWQSTGGWSAATTVPWEVQDDGRVTPAPATAALNERCTICHRGPPGASGKSDKNMIIKGIDLYIMTAVPSASNTNCLTCHENPHLLHKGKGYPTDPQENCNCHMEDPSFANMQSDNNTSLHLITASPGSDPNNPNPGSCEFRCHNNHGQRNPTRAFNVWLDAQNRSAGSANYEYSSGYGSGGLCLSCHGRSVQTSARTGGTSNSTAYISRIYSQAADGRPGFASSAHNYLSNPFQVGGQEESSFSFIGNCIKCHRSSNQAPATDKGSKYGPHASANRSLLVYPTDADGAAGGKYELLCLRCHTNAGGASGGSDYWTSRQMPTVAWRISQAFAADVNASGVGTEGHAWYMFSSSIDRHRAAEGTQPFWMNQNNRHVECVDCHNPHYVSQSYNYWASLPYTGSVNELESPTQGVISKVLRGVWGVYPTTNWSSIPISTAYTTNYNSAEPIGRLFRTESAQKQAYICLKCHSSYAYGTRGNERPVIPSGIPSVTYAGTPEATLRIGPQTDVLAEFNPNNYSYHPIFSPGRNQPTPGLNRVNWEGAFGRNSAAYDVTGGVSAGRGIGLTSAFVPPFGASSLIVCSDCHSHSSASYSRGYYTSALIAEAEGFPRGPHGSSRRWLLTTINNSIRILRNNNSWFDYSTITDSDRYLCLNCHRADVYGDEGTAITANAWKLSRPGQHPPGDTGRTAVGTNNVFGIMCRNCHGGRTIGGIHGSSVGKEGGLPTYSSKRMLNGAVWLGTGRTTTVTEGTCWTKGASAAPDAVTICNQGHTGGVSYDQLATYDYDTGADP